MTANPPRNPARIVLLRHAETSAPGLFHGAESDVDLGPNGFEQARQAGLRLAPLGPSAVYSSTMLRARQTAGEIAGAAGLDARAVDGLHERRMGRLSGRPQADGWGDYVAAMRRWMAGDLDATHEGGESYRSIRDRAVPAVERIARAHAGGLAIVVAHGVVIRVVLSSIVEGLNPSHFDRLGIGFVAENDLTYDGSTWTASRLDGKPAEIG